MQYEKKQDIYDILIKAATFSFGKGDISQYLEDCEKLKKPKKLLRRIKRAIRRSELYKNGKMSIKQRLLTLMLFILLFATVILYALPVFLLLGADLGVLKSYDFAALLTGRQGEDMLLYTAMDFREPTAFPENTVKKELVRYSAAYSVVYVIDGGLVHYTQTVKGKEESTTAAVGDMTVHILVCGNLGAVRVSDTDDGRLYEVHWSDGEYSYTLTGHTSIEELVKTAESVYDKQGTR